MRVLLGVPWFFPDSVGGTEVYVRALAQELRSARVDVAIATPISGTATETYVDGLRVFRFPAPYGAFGEIDLDRAEPSDWCDILDRFEPTVVDLHALTTGLELPHLKAARRRGARTVVTVHIPGIVCARG